MNQKLHVFFKSMGVLSLLLLVNGSIKAQYCTPAYITTQCSSYDMYIQNFSTTGGQVNITNNGTGCGNTSTSYIYYNTKQHRGVQGTNVNFSVTIGVSYPQGINIYVDYNIDGDFSDAGEQVFTQLINANSTATGSFTIPALATPGASRMRVRSSYSTTAHGPCDNQNYGECEDYDFTIVPSCSAKFLVEPLNSLNCEGDTVKYEVMRAASQSVRWQMNTGAGWVNMSDGGVYSGTTTDELKLSGVGIALQNYQFRAVATNTTENCSVNSAAGKLTLIPSSKASIVVTAAPDTQICKMQEIVFQTSYTNGGSTPQYRWLLNGVQLQGQVNASLKIDTLEHEDYIQCQFISSGQCVFPALSDPITFDVVSQLTPDVSLKVENNFDGTHTFTATALYGGTNPKFYWFVNGKMQTAVSGPTFTTGNLNTWEKVSVGLYSSLDCAEPKYVTSNLKTTGVAQISEGNVAIYPNPNKGEFTITASGIGAASVKVNITNLVGQVVYSQTVPVVSGTISQVVNVNAAPGVYMARIETDGYAELLKFTISE